MSIKFWRRLAGCIAIECCLTAAPRPEYRAGAARSEHARVVVLEDRRGFRALFAEADFPVTRDVADFVAVQLVKLAGMDRAGIVIGGSGSALPESGEIVAAAAKALASLAPATVTYDGVISVRTEDGDCLATLYPVRFDGCREGAPAHGPIRAAFQMVDVPHGLQTRGNVAPGYPVQAVVIGKTATVLALGGDVPAGRYAAAGRIVVGRANDATAVAPDEVVEKAVAAVLRRVR
jgi:hypothetical protein